jgi:hypothetical protein
MTLRFTAAALMILQLAGFSTACSQVETEQSSAESKGLFDGSNGGASVNTLKVVEPMSNPADSFQVRFEYANSGTNLYCQRSDFDEVGQRVQCYPSLDAFQSANAGSSGTKLKCDSRDPMVKCKYEGMTPAG